MKNSIPHEKLKSEGSMIQKDGVRAVPQSERIAMMLLSEFKRIQPIELPSFGSLLTRWFISGSGLSLKRCLMEKTSTHGVKKLKRLLATRCKNDFLRCKVGG